MKFNKIGFIGLGLIGGSIAKKIHIEYPNTKLIAISGREETITLAHEMGLIENDKICHNGLYLAEIRRWQQIRDEQYTAIFDSVDDFAYQAMIKKALSLLLSEENLKERLNKDSWKLTDASILHKYLLENEKSKQIMHRVQLCRPFHCIGILYIKGKSAAKYINSNISQIENVASEYFKRVLSIGDDDDRVKSLSTNVVVANFYPDKRKRPIYTEALLMGTRVPIDEQNETPVGGALLGLFTPLHNANRKTVDVGDGKTERKMVAFKQKDLAGLIVQLKEHIFQNYEISIYGRENT